MKLVKRQWQELSTSEQEQFRKLSLDDREAYEVKKRDFLNLKALQSENADSHPGFIDSIKQRRAEKLAAKEDKEESKDNKD